MGHSAGRRVRRVCWNDQGGGVMQMVEQHQGSACRVHCACQQGDGGCAGSIAIVPLPVLTGR